MKSCICFALVLLFPLLASASPRYSEKSDDFSNETIRMLTLKSVSTPGTLFMSCRPDGITVQLSTPEVLFPDDSDDREMLISVTYKFDTSDKAVTDVWSMYLMKYSDAWLKDSQTEFVATARNANALSLRFNKRGQVFKFSLKGVAGSVDKILAACQ